MKNNRLKVVNTKPKQKTRGAVMFSKGQSHQAPVVKEERNAYGKQFIKYGEDNDFYSKLIEMYMLSPTNSRCINGISDMIYGKGLNATNSEEKKLEFAEMKLLFNPTDLRRMINDLKHLGEGMFQVVYNNDKSKIKRVIHTPRETWRAAKAVRGVVTKYYYHPSWKDYQRNDKLKELPTFKNGGKKELVELYIIKPYRSGFYYYSPPDYQGCLQYCELEKEVSNYHINNVQQGFSPAVMINFNNGVPGDEQQELIADKIHDKLTGTSGDRIVIGFNDDAEDAATIDAVHLPDAHAQYEFMSAEAREKIMLGHGIGSPILLGIKDNTGFGNNAEEIRTASILMDNNVIIPFQNMIIGGLDELLFYNGIVLNLYFETLQPIEFTEVDNIKTKIKREEETGEKLSAHDLTHTQEDLDIWYHEQKLLLNDVTTLEDFDDDAGDDMLNQLEGLGEHISDDWELIHSEVVKDSEKPFKMPEEMAQANPNEPSSQDKGVFKVRYAYSPVRNSADSRKFCKHMEGFTKKNVVFRKEDINMMSFRGVNKELGHNKQNYSLMKFKGGKNCHHFWELRVYKLKVAKGNRVADDKVKVSNPKETPIRPIDMPNNGAHPSAKR